MKTTEKNLLLRNIDAIPTMERGKLSTVSLKDQSPNAGPYHKLQYWQNGKNHTRHVTPAEVPALQAAIAGYTQFCQLTEQYAELVIAETRQTIAGLKKKDDAPEILLAQDEEIQRLIASFQAQAPQGTTVAQLELLVRTAVFKSANALVGWLLQQAADRIDHSYQPKPGEVRKARETIGVQGIFGSFELNRDYYYHEGKKLGHHPADDALGLEVCYTPALAKLMSLEGADESTYLKAERHLEQTGGILVSARQIQRVVQRVGSDAQRWQERPAQPGSCDASIMYVSGDGTGVPMVPEELEGRRGKQSDGKAKTRQVYLGCVFTQHKVDEEGHPIRDWQSTTYVSSFKSIDEFGPLLRQEAIRRGLGDVPKTVLLIDGAAGLENMGELNFKNCVQIVDFYHAMEHAGTVLAALIGKHHPDYEKRQHRWAKQLLKDEVQVLIDQTRAECAGQPQAEAVEKALGYFVRNVGRMQYGTFRAAGYFIGSGVVEAGCKTVIGARCKQSGMFWSEAGAENILALRCIHSSRRLDDYWKHRLNDHAARNDCLPLVA
jgi:hypothetical protein